MKLILFSFITSFVFYSCSKDAEIKPDETMLSLHFKHFMGNDSLKLKSTYYQNAAKDSFSVSSFRYFVGKIKGKSSQNKQWITLSNNYFLIDEEFNKEISALNIPFQQYDSLLFEVGVDSVNTYQSDFKGDLSQSTGMYWEWNKMYIHFMLDGYYKQTSTYSRGYVFHLSGFENVQKVKLSMSDIVFAKNKLTTLNLKVDILKYFEKPQLIDFNTYNNVTTGKQAQEVAPNLKSIFSIVN